MQKHLGKEKALRAKAQTLKSRRPKAAKDEPSQHARGDTVALCAAELEQIPLGEIDLLRKSLAQQSFRTEISAAHSGFRNAERVRRLLDAQLFHGPQHENETVALG